MNRKARIVQIAVDPYSTPPDVYALDDQGNVWLFDCTERKYTLFVDNNRDRKVPKDDERR